METQIRPPALSASRILDRLFDRPVGKMMTTSIWRLVWMTVLVSEILTAIMNTIMGFVWWGAFSRDLVLIGCVDALVVSMIAASFLLYVVMRLRESEIQVSDERARAAEGLRKINEDLERRVTERTAELEKSEGDYRMLMEQASDGILITDRVGNVISVNTRGCEILARPREEILRLNLKDFVPAEDLAVEPLRFRELYEGKTIVSERRVLHKEGATLHVEVSAKMLEDGRLLLLIRDISGRKRAEAENKLLQARLFKAQKMEAIGTLAGGVAHDFNNLLTVMKGETEVALADLKESDPMHVHMRQINRAAGRAAELTKKLLLFGRRQPIEPMPMDLNRAVGDMLEMFRRIIGEDITIDAALCDGPCNVLADASGMEQVIMNMVVNAKNAMPGGGKLTIMTENLTLDDTLSKRMPDSRPGEFVCLTVSDTGTGMDPEKLLHIFDPFFSASEHKKGTGLGLSVVYGIVEQHFGWINVSSEPGRGSTFKVYLEACRERPALAADEIISPDGWQGAGERVLLVEDEELVSDLSAMVLRRQGYQVFVAPDAEAAFMLFEKEKGRFDLVFSDVVLPGESGVELVGRLHMIDPSLPVLLTSGYTDQKSQWPVIRERGYRFLEKPYQIEDLLRYVREAVASTSRTGPGQSKGRSSASP